ncbi:MAG: HAMP domain-containing histidine kinase, partial [Bdellovibrionales bacterium]|nr:HAMP domain-containing histidine kinase [Bdellovibrionales bacterium]
AAGVAHEINNPLTIVMGFAKIIENEINKTSNPSQRALEALQKIELSAERIAGIVMGLRSFSRVDSPVSTQFELVPLVRETVVMLDRMFQKEGISMTVEADDDNGRVLEGSPGKIQQILVNLLTNSKDAFEEGVLKQVTVSISKQEDAVILKIEDTGKGISPEIQEKIFEPFFTTKDVNDGTGLGLSIVHTLVMEHKGKIEVSSQLGKGTVFIMTFPLAQDSQSIIAA